MCDLYYLRKMFLTTYVISKFCGKCDWTINITLLPACFKNKKFYWLNMKSSTLRTNTMTVSFIKTLLFSSVVFSCSKSICESGLMWKWL
jgi:hypothetical protein